MNEYGLNDTLLSVRHSLYEFSNDFDAQCDIGKVFVSKKLVPWKHFYFSYALER